MNFRKILAAALLIPALSGAFPGLNGLFPTPAPAAEAPKVVASIKPIHSLVSQVMQGVGQPGLIVDGAGSPHTYALKPSDAAELEQADLIFWVGEALEPFLAKPLETLGGNATVVQLSEAEGLPKLPFRESGPFDVHEHEDASTHEHENHEDGHDSIDMHLWLDPENAKVLVSAIEQALSKTDPANAEVYRQNARQAVANIEVLKQEIAADLATVKDRPFVVFHDAYQYFERHFRLRAVGSITVSPEVAASAQRVAEIRERVTRLRAVCVFSEPQFEPRIVETVIEGTSARSGVLDPEGADIPNGPELYPTLLRNLAKSLKACLSGEG